MYGLDYFDYFEYSRGFGVASAIVFFAILVAGAAVLIVYIFSSLGLMNLAKENDIENVWMAWLPCARDYLLGKLGFELYADTDKKNPTLTWVLLGLSAGSIFLNKFSISSLVGIAVVVFQTMAYYNIFKKIAKDKEVVFTVITALTGGMLGGIFLYALKNNIVKADNIKEADVTDEKEINKEKTKKDNNINFCGSCGSKVAKDNKFCSNCGKEIK